jgi:hypothetical protein
MYDLGKPGDVAKKLESQAFAEQPKKKKSR